MSWIDNKRRAYHGALERLLLKMAEKCLDKEWLDAAALQLGMGAGGSRMFYYKKELDAFMDYVLIDFRKGDRRVVEIYRDTHGPADETEGELLDALTASRTSFFRVERADDKSNIISMVDLLRQGECVSLNDLDYVSAAFGLSIFRGQPIFCRLVPCREFTMTTGLPFLFHDDDEGTLLARYEELRNNGSGHGEAAARFIAFFTLNRELGIKEIT